MADDNLCDVDTDYSASGFRRNDRGTTDATKLCLRPDLGITNQCISTANPSVLTQDSNEMPKKEENPFSFKHFLRTDVSSIHQQRGARPKVYPSVPSGESFKTLVSKDTDVGANVFGKLTATRGSSELTTVLPDFVQDHLVVEQCYLSHSNDHLDNQHISVDPDNLPDFAITSTCVCELTAVNAKGQDHTRDESTYAASAVLQAETIGPSITETRLPFDLPLHAENKADAPHSVFVGSKNGPQLGEGGLPDFLSDGPIYSDRIIDEHKAPPNPSGSTSGEHSRLVEEKVVLLSELKATRYQLLESGRRIAALEKELHALKLKDHEETASLAKAMEQVEDNLKRTTRRAVTAENLVSKLKQEVKSLSQQKEIISQENLALRQTNLSGRAKQQSDATENERTCYIATQLRQAASSAEDTLRQLMVGVSNLRLIASSIENLGKLEEQPDCASVDREDAASPKP